MAKKIFITGTGTDVGKTYVAGLIVKKLCNYGERNAYYKAAMSGNDRDDVGNLIPGDALWVKKISGLDQDLDSMCPYVYEAAVSPHLASRFEGNPVRMGRVKEGFNNLCREYDFITMEGSGGILCPLAFDSIPLSLEDVVRELELNSLIIADAGLGTINSFVLTVEYMRSKGLRIGGAIFNRFQKGNALHEDNLLMCERLTGVKILACVQEGDVDLEMDVETLKNLYRD